MNKQELKDTISNMLLFEPMDIDVLTFGEYEIKETQEVWNNLKQESKELIETYVLAEFYHIICSIKFSSIFEKINGTELTDNDNGDDIDNKGNIKFTKFDTLNVIFDNVLDTIVEFEFMDV